MNENDATDASDARAIVTYRIALMALIERAGGELFVPVSNPGYQKAGTILWRQEADGIRFRFHQEGTKQ